MWVVSSVVQSIVMTVAWSGNSEMFMCGTMWCSTWIRTRFSTTRQLVNSMHVTHTHMCMIHARMYVRCGYIRVANNLQTFWRNWSGNAIMDILVYSYFLCSPLCPVVSPIGFCVSVTLFVKITWFFAQNLLFFQQILVLFIPISTVVS